MLELTTHQRGIILPVRARAGGRRNGVTGIRDGALAISVTQVPEAGKANRAIVALLAKLFGCGKGRIELITGKTSRTKRFLLIGIDREEMLRSIENALEE